MRWAQKGVQLGQTGVRWEHVHAQCSALVVANLFATPSLAGRKAETFTAWGGIYLRGCMEGVQHGKTR